MPKSATSRRLVGRRIVPLLGSLLTAAVLLAGLFQTAATGSMVAPSTAEAAAAPPQTPSNQSTLRQPQAARNRLYDSLDTRHTQGVAWGDIDGDGDLDLVVGNGLPQGDPGAIDTAEYAQRNQIYLNQGSGQFIEVEIGSNSEFHQRDTRSVAWGDFDGDGDLDLAVGNGGGETSQQNQVYENVRGTLQLDLEQGIGWESPDTADSRRVAWGDWDGDGDLDLAVGNEGTANQVFENISGTLTISETAGIGWNAPQTLTTADLAWGDWDGDGDLDLAVGNYGSSDQIYENISNTLRLDPAAGIGWQSPATDDILSDLTQAVSWGDWDNDGDLDLATGGGSRDSVQGSFVRVYENISGTLQLDADVGWQRLSTSGVDSWAKPAALEWVDWDNDGDLDLALGNNRGAEAGYRNQIYLNENGALQFSPFQGIGWQSPIRASLNEETTYALALGDADGDGDVDLAVGNGGASNGGQTNYIFRNDFPVVAFDERPQHSADALPSSSVAWGDWDGDDDLDLAVGNDGAPNQVYENVAGVLVFDPAADLGWAAPISDTAATAAVAWGDWDGDGDLDLAVGNDGAPDRVYENDSRRLLLDPANGWGWQTSISDTGRTRSLAWGDWDLDGDLDLAVGKRLEPAQVFENEAGLLALDPANGLGWTSPVSITAESVAWGDWDDDDDPDLALGSRVYENDDGTLTLDESAGLGWNGRTRADSVAWGDMNGDGALELAMSTGTRLRVYHNTGQTLAFAPRSGIGWQYFQTVHGTGVAWGDADGDGDLDLASSNAAPGGGFEPNQVFENIGGMLDEVPAWETADERATDGVLIQSQDVAWGDVDNDGDMDLAFANACSVAECTVAGRPNQIYLNPLQRRSAPLPTFAVPLISVIDPDSNAAANFFASPEIVTSNAISIPYSLIDPNGTPVGRLEVFYSLDGGDNWQPAEPTAATQTTNLAASPAGTQHVFGWDTFESDFFGRSDNVAFRFVVYRSPEANRTTDSDDYRYFNGVANSFQRPAVTAATYPFRVQSTQVTVVDEAGNPVEGAVVYRLPAGQVDGALYMPEPTRPRLTDENGLLPGGGRLELGDRLVALRPSAELPTDFTSKARLFHTSAAVTEDGLDMFEFTAPGEIELVIRDSNPLLLFDLDAALEWNASTDPTFMSDLTDSFQRASEILYDVSNGQIAIGRINIFQDKELWPQADIVVLANNSMRPSAAIGGIAQRPVSETVLVSPGVTKVISNAYGGGQIRMGTVWDPFGENTAELGEQWWRALAHELAHYLLFLPDNYLGFREEGVLGKINCQGSFMTSTYDPAYSELLTEAEWADSLHEACRNSLAEVTTGRGDWETVIGFYEDLQEPPEGARPFEGPGLMPLPLTWLSFWPSQDGRLPLRARTFDIRAESNDRIRLPAAQAYLFQEQGTPDPTDDMIINLGTPTGGGDRLKVRGAYEGDRLCLIDPNTSSSDGATTGFIGCEDDLEASDIAMRVGIMDQTWQPQIQVRPVTSRTFEVTITQPVSEGEEDSLRVQLYPLHYWSVPGTTGLSPTSTLQTEGDRHTAALTMLLPAYELAARVWDPTTPGRETVGIFNLNPPWQTATSGGLESTGGSDDGATGGPNSSGIGGPNSSGIGGPNSSGIGGPNSSGIGGPNSSGIGGPNSAGIGGPNSTGIGGPNASGIGGPNSSGIGGPNSSGIGGPNSSGIGGPNSSGIGGPNSSGIGGPNSSGIGGPNSSGIGGPNSSGIGGADRSFNAPILSADAQVVIYSKRGFFEDNGVETLQTLGSVPGLLEQPWLVPVGQAYHVELTPDVTDDRVIALNYLQRDVPEGFEHTLTIYFLPDGETEWRRLETSRFSENLVVADLQDSSGAYAVMSAIEMPAMEPGWNQFVYPLPDPRPVTDVLRSISGAYSIVYRGSRPETTPTELPTTNVEQFEFGRAYWVWIHEDETVTPYLRPPLRSPDGYVPGS